MEWLREFRRRLLILLRRDRFDCELEEEMRLHLEMVAEANREKGMDSVEASYSARRQFGNPTFLKEASREVWNWRWLESLARERGREWCRRHERQKGALRLDTGVWEPCASQRKERGHVGLALA